MSEKKVLLAFHLSGKESQAQCNQQPQKLPQACVLIAAPMGAPAAARPCMGTMSSLRRTSRETIMTVFTQGNKGTPLRKVIVGICFQECHGLHVRDLRTLGVVNSLSEERGWQNGFTPVLRRNGDAVRKSCPRSVMTAFFSTDDNF